MYLEYLEMKFIEDIILFKNHISNLSKIFQHARHGKVLKIRLSKV